MWGSFFVAFRPDRCVPSKGDFPESPPHTLPAPPVNPIGVGGSAGFAGVSLPLLAEPHGVDPQQNQYTTIFDFRNGFHKKVLIFLEVWYIEPMSDELRTTKEAADALRVTPATIRLWVKTGLIDSRKLPSGQKRIPQSAIDKIKEPSNDAT